MTNKELLNAILGAGYVLGTAMRKNILNADSIMMERYAKKYGVAVKSEIELEHDQFWAKVAEYKGLKSELTSVTRGFYADEEEAAKIREKMETLRNYLNANCIKIGGALNSHEFWASIR